MRERYVVDTNVLIAASAADPLHPKDIDATPDDPSMRLIVWKWLDEFDTGPSRIVLDATKEQTWEGSESPSRRWKQPETLSTRWK